jgi:putative membrane protein
MPILESVGYRWWDWHLHPDVVLLCLGLLAAYFYAINDLRPRISDAGRVKRSQTVYFVLGVLAIYIAAGSPVHDIAENYLVSVHMLQHLLLTLVAPPLLLAGTPSWLWQALIRGPRVFAVAKLLTNPLVAFGTFNFLLVITHLPHVGDYALREHWFHFVLHATITAAAMMLWWPVLSNVPELPRLSYPLQMGYLFVQSLLPAVIASFFTFSQSSIYTFYAEAPRLWGIGVVEDQQLAALVMKLLGSIILWSFIGVAFFKWYAQEEAESRGPRWTEVEEELRELGLNPRQ